MLLLGSIAAICEGGNATASVTLCARTREEEGRTSPGAKARRWSLLQARCCVRKPSPGQRRAQQRHTQQLAAAAAHRGRQQRRTSQKVRRAGHDDERCALTLAQRPSPAFSNSASASSNTRSSSALRECAPRQRGRVSGEPARRNWLTNISAKC
jgi:hypothetical protein